MEAKCAFFLALLGCLEIVCIEGRPFWPKNTEQFINETEEANYQKRELGEQPNQPSTPPAENEQKTPPNYIDSADHSVAGSDSGFAAYNHKDDFRPTTPGNSPGVGHKYTNSRAQIEQKARKFVTTGTKDDYRPTAPGHSPGVGHHLQVENAKPSP